MHHDKQGRTHKVRGFLGLLYITACTFAAMYAPQPMLSAIHAEYGTLSSPTITLLMTATILPLSVAPLLYGAFLTSVPARSVLLGCVSVLGLAGIGICLSQSFAMLLVFRTVQGLVIPAVLTCLMAHISAKFHGDELQRALALYIGTTIIGGLLGRTVGGCAASLLGWRYAVLVVNLCLLAGIVPLLYLKKRSQAHFARVSFSEFAAILKTPGIPRLLLIEACGFFVFAALANCLPFRLTELSGDVSEWRIAVMYMGYGVGALVAFNSRRIIALCGGEVKTIFYGVGLYGVTLLGFLSPHMGIIFLTMCLICLGQFMEHTTSPGLINRMADHDRGAVNGLYLSCYYFGGALGSYLPVLVYTLWGWTAFILVLMSALLCSLLATWGLERHTPHV